VGVQEVICTEPVGEYTFFYGKGNESGENCITRRMRWAGHVARMGEKRIEYRLLVGKRPL
jgi:hypothetical protein